VELEHHAVAMGGHLGGYYTCVITNNNSLSLKLQKVVISTIHELSPFIEFLVISTRLKKN